MSETWVVWCREDCLVLLGILRVVSLAPYDQLLELANVESVAFGLIDLFDHVPQNLDFFLFRPDLVPQIIDLFARVRLLFGTAVWGRLQQDFLLQFCICAFFDSNRLLEPLYLLELLCHHLVQPLYLLVCSFLLLGKFLLKLLRQLLYLLLLLLLQPNDSLQFLLPSVNLLLVTLLSLFVNFLTFLNRIPLCAHFTHLVLQSLFHDAHIVPLRLNLLILDLQLHLHLY